MNRRTFVVGTAGLTVLRPPKGLKAAVRGHVFVPGDRGYTAAARVYNERWDGIRPPAVVRPADAKDVRALVRWAGDHDATLVPRSGGHAYNGASTSRTAVVVDLKHLDGVQAGPIARIGPAARNIEVYAALARHGRGWAGGSCPTVGAGGLALGGGIGYAGRRHGLTTDTIVACDVVTADGHLRRIGADTDPDLFFALRGGGGNFGIVTALHIRTFTVRRAARYSAAGVDLAAWDAFAPTAPRELSSFFTLQSGRASSQGQFLGSESALRRVIRPLGSATTATDDYLSLQRRWAACADGGLARCLASTRTSFAAASVYVSKPLTAAARRDFTAASHHATLVLDAYGGAINDVPADATAFVHRSARFSVQILAYGPGAAARVRHAHALVAPHGNGEAYQNYADPSLKGYATAWYGSNLPRLRDLKRRYDPDHRFTIHQGL